MVLCVISCTLRKYTLACCWCLQRVLQSIGVSFYYFIGIDSVMLCLMGIVFFLSKVLNRITKLVKGRSYCCNLTPEWGVLYHFANRTLIFLLAGYKKCGQILIKACEYLANRNFGRRIKLHIPDAWLYLIWKSDGYCRSCGRKENHVHWWSVIIAVI